MLNSWKTSFLLSLERANLRPLAKVVKEDMEKLQRELIETPQVQLSDAAFGEISLMKENDLTLDDKSFRVSISGKGCDGFDYSPFFSKKHPDDFVVKVTRNHKAIEILFDPFAAYYLAQVNIDYVNDYLNDQEGFVVTNIDQKKFKGKFWKQDKSLVPPELPEKI